MGEARITGDAGNASSITEPLDGIRSSRGIYAKTAKTQSGGIMPWVRNRQLYLLPLANFASLLLGIGMPRSIRVPASSLRRSCRKFA